MSTLSELREAKAEVESKIREQIAIGEEIAARDVRSDADLDRLRTDSVRWYKFTRRLLTTLFADDNFGSEFENAPGPGVAFLGGGPPPSLAERRETAVDPINDRLDALRSIIDALPLMSEPSQQKGASSMPVRATANPRDVFVVHGRNERARKALFSFLRSVDLNPMQWSEAIQRAGKGSPFIGEVLDVAFAQAQAIIILMTGDDEAQLRMDFRGANEPSYETDLTPQARPNVIFEAGMAFGRDAERTIIVQMGPTRPISDLSGRHIVNINNTPERRQDLISRLLTAGCAAKTVGNDWLSEGDFSVAIVQGPH